MILECVIVCHNYSDFLATTLPDNMQFFDRVVVVTGYEDKKTQALCAKYSVDCVQTGIMHDRGAAFNKGLCVNLGLGHLHQTDWVLHLDADIVLPHDFRRLLDHARLRKENLYGADRVNVYGYEHWNNHKHKREPSHVHRYFIEPPHEFPLGARIIHHDHGYVPIGYFQLWHGTRRYPTHQGNAEHTDVLFACQWPRYQRVLLPEIICYHLESATEPGPFGTNWSGRVTPPFEPKPYSPDLKNWKVHEKK